jgi:hypothetical protein
MGKSGLEVFDSCCCLNRAGILRQVRGNLQISGLPLHYDPFLRNLQNPGNSISRRQWKMGKPEKKSLTEAVRLVKAVVGMPRIVRDLGPILR